MNSLTLGSTYRKGFIDTEHELIPQNRFFKAFADEKHFFEERKEPVSFYQIRNAVECGKITDFDKTVLSVIAVFGNAACTTKTISEMLTMMGVETTRNNLEHSVKRLHRYHLINLSRFCLPGGEPTKTRIITLARYGSWLAKDMGVVHIFKPFASANAKPYMIKSWAHTAQLVCNWLKNLPVESFAVRKVTVSDQNADEETMIKIRPASSVKVWGETLYFEVPRRHEEWKEELVEKMSRYKLVFGENSLPTVVINGEDEEMNLEINKALEESGYSGEVLYTDDLASFGRNFRTSLYSFDKELRKIVYNINITEREAV